MKRSRAIRPLGLLRASPAELAASALLLFGCSSESPSSAPAQGAGGAGGAAVAGGGGSAGASVAGSGQGGSSGVGGAAAGGAGGRIWPMGAPADDQSFGPNVLVFDPGVGMASIQSQLDAHFTQQEDNQFGDERYAYFFKPGKYELDVRVGYYQHVLGVGRSPDGVEITGAVRSNDRSGGSALSNFWRAWENMALVPSPEQYNTWAVSQSAPVRRVHVLGSLVLSDAGYSSGGFLADSIIGGNVQSGSQQQWFSRNVSWGGWQGGVFNMVFVGAQSPPAGEWPTLPYTKVATAPVVREKPYLIRNDDGTYVVRVPSLSADTSGPSWATGETPGLDVSTAHFYLARPETDTAATLNAKLAEGYNLLFTPGVYELDGTLQVTQPETLVLGVGLPTLVANAGVPAMTVADVDGVILSGLVFDAGPAESSTLLEVGPAGSSVDHSARPTSLHDIFCRVGGRSEGAAASCVTINSNHVIADHLWLWRADHGAGATDGQRPGWEHNRSANGLIVNGDNVTAYGLFVEHFQEYQVLWNGDGGRSYFFQSEMPYDPPTQEAWQHDGVRGYAAYKVKDDVTTHEAQGLGVYAIFLTAAVVADNAIETPVAPGVLMSHMVTVWLNGMTGSSIASVWNGQGGAVTESEPKAMLD